MPRPPLALWAFVFALGLGVIYADIRRDDELAQLEALKRRVTSAEKACFLTRSPHVVAEGR